MAVPVARRDRKWIWYLVAAALVWAAIAFGSDVVGWFTSPSKPPFDLRTVGTSCPDDHSWTCGRIAVPLDRSAPGKGTVSVHFRVLPRVITANPSAGTIVVVAGGPGQSTMSQYSWAQYTFREYLADHDLLLVDNRGTGESGAINCPLLEAQQPYLTSTAVAQCRDLLGSRADDYGTVAAVDDLDQILTTIHSRRVDLYAESYGTYFAQVFTLRHPRILQRMVLDGAYPLAVDPWHRDDLPAALADIRAVCRADASCRARGDPVAELARVLPGLRDQSISGQTSDAFGRLVTVEGSVANLAFELEEAGRDGSAYRELPAALAAATRAPDPDPVPLLRLIAERQRPIFGSTRDTAPAATDLSIGLLVADTCADYPQPFQLTAPLTEQRAQLSTARAQVVASANHSFAPFTADEVLGDGATCVGWPASTSAPPVTHAPFPKVPTLVLEGALDTITPAAGARAVAQAFPDGQYLVIPNVGHVTGLADNSGCAGGIAAEFLVMGTTDPSCTARIPAVATVDAFPTQLAEEPPAAPVIQSQAAGLSSDDLRAIAVARDAVSDVLWRWGRVGILSGRGLRGGTFGASGPLGQANVTLVLDHIAWTTDTTVSGSLAISPSANSFAGTLLLTTPTGTVQLGVQSNLFGAATVMTINGNLSGHTFTLLVDAPLSL